jgi:hypothetical protein
MDACRTQVHYKRCGHQQATMQWCTVPAAIRSCRSASASSIASSSGLNSSSSLSSCFPYPSPAGVGSTGTVGTNSGAADVNGDAPVGAATGTQARPTLDGPDGFHSLAVEESFWATAAANDPGPISTRAEAELGAGPTGTVELCDENGFQS